MSEPPMVIYVEATKPFKSVRIQNTARFLFKLAISATCLWYVARQIDVADFNRLLATFDYAWASLATLIIMAETPLTALRWRQIVNALVTDVEQIPVGPAVAITAIGVFVGQILPNVAADAVRVWLLSRVGRSWRHGLVSVVIDRGVGVFSLFTIGFATLLYPSAFSALRGHRIVVLEIFGLVLATTVAGVLVVPYIGSVLARFSLTRLLGKLASATHYVMISSRSGIYVLAIAFTVHLLTICSVWSLGRAQGLILSVVDAALLFTFMLSVSLIPVSIGGWGLRELAVSALLGSYGVPLEQALFFSVSFGLSLMVAALPGAVVWATFSPARHTMAARVEHE
jgi:uncharacterized membrane protein YbhN (UPF0104 family)